MKDLRFPKDVSLGAVVKKDDEILSPRGDTIIEAGDMVVMFVPIKSMKKSTNYLALYLDQKHHEELLLRPSSQLSL